jgi:protein involved in polysaccharide export with SLBB domain
MCRLKGRGERIVRWFAIMVLSVTISGCWLKTTPSTPVVMSNKFVPASTLGSGDVFEVKVYDEQELSGIYRISSSGSINFPLIGRVQIEGLTSSDAADVIQEKLAERFLKDPQVSIFVKEYNSKKVSVFGQVNKPGTFNYEDRMTVIQAVSMAGGFTNIAAKNDINVTRIVENEEKKFFVPVEAIAEGKAKNFFLDPGDIVYVPESIW